MKSNEKESVSFALKVVNDIVCDLQEKIDLNDKMIEGRRSSSAASIALSNDVLRVSRMIKETLENKSMDSDERISKSLEIVTALNSSLEALPQSEREEIIRLESSQDGMRRVIEAFKSSASEKLVQSEQIKATQEQQSMQDLDWDDT